MPENAQLPCSMSARTFVELFLEKCDPLSRDDRVLLEHWKNQQHNTRSSVPPTDFLCFWLDLGDVLIIAVRYEDFIASSANE